MGQPKPSDRKKSRQDKPFLKYTSLGLQMVITLAIAGWLGYLLDEKLSFQFPVFLLLFIFSALAGSIYMLIKNLPKDE